MSKASAAPPEPMAENPFAKFPDWLLADTIGDIDADLDTKEERLKLAKAEMDRRHRPSVIGTRFTITKSIESIKRLNSAGLKKKYGQGWWDSWCKPGNRTKWTITALPPAEVGTSS